MNSNSIQTILIALGTFFTGLVFTLYAIPATTHAARVWSSGAEGSLGEVIILDANTSRNTTTVHSGLGSFRAQTTNSAAFFGLFITNDTPLPDTFTRFYFRAEDLPSEPVAMFSAGDGESGFSLLRLNPNGTLSWMISDGSTVATSSTALSPDTWYRIEIGYDAGSTVTLRIDGTQEFSTAVSDMTGISTVLFGICDEAGFTCGGDVATADFYFDDIAINDTTGSVQNSWPGEGKIIHMQPDGSAGDNNGASSGSCADVDEAVFDEGATFAVLNDNNDILDCTMESSSNAGLTGTETITLVQPGVRAAPATSGGIAGRVRIKSASGGTILQSSITTTITGSAGVYMTNFPQIYLYVFPYLVTSYTDPTTASPWTQSGTNSLDNMQIGVEVTDADPDVRVTSLWALVEYVEAEAQAPARIIRLRGVVKLFNGTVIQ